MKNDTFFNWLLIIVSLMLAIGMFMKGIPYWWVSYIICLISFARWADFLVDTEKQQEPIDFPINRLKEMNDEEIMHMREKMSFDWEFYNEEDKWSLHCKKCGYAPVMCKCKPIWQEKNN